MAHHRRVPVAGRQLDGVEGLGEAADLVDLDEHGVGHTALDAALQPAGVRDEQVVADQLDAAAERLGQGGPAVPVVLGHAVLDGDDRVRVHDAHPVVDELVGAQHLVLAGEVVVPVPVDLADSRVHGDGDVLTGHVAGGVDGLDEELDGVLVRRQVGCEPAFVTDGRVEPPVMQHLLQHVVRLGAPAQRLGEARRADGHDHELLEVDRVVGVDATVDDVHHRHRQDVGIGPADVAVERDLQLVGGRLGDGEARAEDGVGAEAGLVVCAVELAEGDVDGALSEGVGAAQLVGDLAVDERHGRGHALAAVTLATVAELDGLVLTGRRTARHGGPPGRPARQHDLDLDGRVAAGVEDLPAQDVHDLGHRFDRSRGIAREPAGMDLQLTGKRAIVTGGSKGIGKAVARALSAEGCDVVIASRTASTLDETALEISSATGGRVVPITVDTGEDASVRALVADATEALGGIDILVNSAAKPLGQSAPPKLADVTGTAFWDDMNVKVLGYLRCSQAVAPGMIAQGWGRIINISGLGARDAVRRSSGRCATSPSRR